jgi:hypothetical protein
MLQANWQKAVHLALARPGASAVMAFQCNVGTFDQFKAQPTGEQVQFSCYSTEQPVLLLLLLPDLTSSTSLIAGLVARATLRGIFEIVGDPIPNLFAVVGCMCGRPDGDHTFQGAVYNFLHGKTRVSGSDNANLHLSTVSILEGRRGAAELHTKHFPTLAPSASWTC